MIEPTDPAYQAEYQRLNGVLYADLLAEDEFDRIKPFLAHYTSLEVLEKILTGNEIWLSNPLLMNDLEEVRFGVLGGVEKVLTSPALATALGTDARRSSFNNAFAHYFAMFRDDHALDTYVFCFSQHDDPNDHDGILSMWRGYGGNGRGAAIVFDTFKIGPAMQGPLILARVHYATAAERLSWIDNKIATLADVVGSVPDGMVHLAAHAIFRRIKLFALFTKHTGFSEEREWRLVYQRDEDPANKLGATLGYLNGPRGIEPKLRLTLKPIAGLTLPDLSLETLVSSILLGPTASSPLALASAKRMVQIVRPALVDRVFSSGIPFRPQ